MLEEIAKGLQEECSLFCLISKEEMPPERMKESFPEGSRE